MPMTREEAARAAEAQATDERVFGGATPYERAEYIEEMTGELERLAAGPRLQHLRDLLRVARIEARRCSLSRAS